MDVLPNIRHVLLQIFASKHWEPHFNDEGNVMMRRWEEENGWVFREPTPEEKADYIWFWASAP